MSELVARTGRHQQRYEQGYGLIAGCIPFRFRDVEQNGGDTSEKIVEVLGRVFCFRREGGKMIKQLKRQLCVKP
ncbi:hypothetical protein K7X08_007467 [Anisodus acutangulus]|uniref:Uncharacterized protein n=1 Tax=Anisodus acutangulus TaxID=402998 RepID=A0A9Q1LE38_9SOLA|nr:hypothetical protein K7X08_007467 [Anisodus acutangulus]